ncbi:MAG: hypothetical protein FWG66_12485 [Spirochaetes bacterium]|nr:hypothetical protein [Spirochaetota bacterium]
MKKTLHIIAAVFSVSLLSACSTAPPQGFATAPAGEASMAALREALLGERPFVNWDGSREYLPGYVASFGHYFFGATPDFFDVFEFALVDMDGDGIVEVILSSFRIDSIHVLHYYGGDVFISHHGIRSLGGLKTDGSFRWSSGAANNGVARLAFNAGHAYQITVAAQDTRREWGSDEIIEDHRIAGEPASLQEVMAFFALHDAKECAPWFPLTEENIARFFP